MNKMKKKMRTATAAARVARAEADEPLESMEEKSGGWVEEARTLAIQIAKEKGEVTAEDIWEQLPPPPEINPCVMGAVFKFGKDNPLQRSGYRMGVRRIAHGRVISIWKIVEQGEKK